MRYIFDQQNMFKIIPKDYYITRTDANRLIFEENNVYHRLNSFHQEMIGCIANLSEINEINIKNAMMAIGLQPDEVCPLSEVIPKVVDEVLTFKGWDIVDFNNSETIFHPMKQKIVEYIDNYNRQLEGKSLIQIRQWNELPIFIETTSYGNIKLGFKRTNVRENFRPANQLVSNMESFAKKYASFSFLLPERDDPCSITDFRDYITKTGRISRKQFYRDHSALINALMSSPFPVPSTKPHHLFYYESLKALKESLTNPYIELFKNKIDGLIQEANGEPETPE